LQNNEIVHINAWWSKVKEYIGPFYMAKQDFLANNYLLEKAIYRLFYFTTYSIVLGCVFFIKNIDCISILKYYSKTAF